MKMVVAFIKKNKFEEVILALHAIEGLTGVSSSEVRGFGRERSRPAPQRSEISLDFQPHIRLESVCRSDLAEEVVSAIKRAAHTGLRGDGKIYVWPVEEAVRISSDESGEEAA